MKYTLLLILISAGCITQASESSHVSIRDITITGYSNESYGIYVGARIEVEGQREIISAQYLMKKYHCMRTNALTGQQTTERDETTACAILEQLETIHKAQARLALLLKPQAVQTQEK